MNAMMIPTVVSIFARTHKDLIFVCVTKDMCFTMIEQLVEVS